MKRKFSEDYQAEYYRQTLAMAGRFRPCAACLPDPQRFPVTPASAPSLSERLEPQGLISETGRRKEAFYYLHITMRNWNHTFPVRSELLFAVRALGTGLPLRRSPQTEDYELKMTAECISYRIRPATRFWSCHIYPMAHIKVSGRSTHCRCQSLTGGMRCRRMADRRGMRCCATRTQISTSGIECLDCEHG